MKHLRALSSIFLVAVSLALLYHFFYIWKYGNHYIQEPNHIILWGETILISLLCVFGMFMFMRDLRRK